MKEHGQGKARQRKALREMYIFILKFSEVSKNIPSFIFSRSIINFFSEIVNDKTAKKSF